MFAEISVELVVAICTGVVSILAAVGALVTSLRNGQTIRKDAADKDQKLAEIHVLVNSRLTQALAEISDLKGTIAAMVPQDREKAQAAVDAARDADTQDRGQAKLDAAKGD